MPEFPELITDPEYLKAGVALKEALANTPKEAIDKQVAALIKEDKRSKLLAREQHMRNLNPDNFYTSL